MSKSTCAIDDCEKVRSRRDWCHSHYRRWRVYGDPLGTAKAKPPVLCSAEGCETKQLAKGLCHKHYERKRRNGSLDYVREPFDRSGDTETHKTCSECGQFLERTEFWKDSRETGTNDGLRSRCKTCEYAAARRTRDRAAESAYLRERKNRPGAREKYRAWFAMYYEANRDAYSAASHKRRALIRGAYVDDGITVAGLLERDGIECVFCGREMILKPKEKHHPRLATVEHLMPLSRGGTHSWENCRLACLSCNMQKNDKTQAEFEIWLRDFGPRRAYDGSSCVSSSGVSTPAH